MEFDVISFILIFTRLTTFTTISKVIFPKGSSNWLKVGFALIISYVLLPVTAEYITQENFTNIMFTYAVVSEILSGFLIAFITNIVFDVLDIVGSWFDVHIGMSMGAMYDTNTGTQMTINSKLLHYTGITLFFILNGHHVLIKSFIHSFITVPLGKNPLQAETALNAMEIIINYFFIGIKIALPLVLIILLTDLCLGLISRVVPQINVMILGMPVKILVSLATTFIALPIIMKVFINLTDKIPSIIDSLFTTGTPGICIICALEEKTEEATPKRKNDSRKKGDVAKSKEVTGAISMIGTILSIMVCSGLLIKTFSKNIIHYIGNAGSLEITDIAIKSISINVVINLLLLTIIMIMPIMIFAIIGNIIQTGFLLAKDKLKPSFKKLNPIKGFQSMFSKRSLVGLIKNIIVTILISYIGYRYLITKAPEILQISNTKLETLGIEIRGLLIGILSIICVILIILGAIDYIIQYRFFNKDLRMTKQEIKEEYKQLEGDPLIKSKIKQRQREMVQRRMMTAVPEATVIITNPTHYAVAIKYEKDGNRPPFVVAKGVDHIALKIKEIAKENKVPIVENRPLARWLYAEIDINKEIPEEMYQAVAQIIAKIETLNHTS